MLSVGLSVTATLRCIFSLRKHRELFLCAKPKDDPSLNALPFRSACPVWNSWSLQLPIHYRRRKFKLVLCRDAYFTSAERRGVLRGVLPTKHFMISLSLLHLVCSSPTGHNADNRAAAQHWALLLFSAHLFCLHPHSSSFSHFPSSLPTFLLSLNSHTSLLHLRRLSHPLLHKVVVSTFNKVSNTRYEPTLPPKGWRHLGKLVKMENFHPNLINNICISKH